jgi:hypothetical protein
MNHVFNLSQGTPNMSLKFSTSPTPIVKLILQHMLLSAWLARRYLEVLLHPKWLDS